MKFKVIGKNIVVTEALKETAIKKVGKLDKYFRRDAEAQITLSVQKNRHIVEVTIPFEGGILRAEEDSQDMYASIDKVIDSLERQIRRNKTKLEKKVHDGSLRFENIQLDDDAEEEPKFEIVRTKKFAIKPMTVEEAVLQMNLLGHQFFMFSNAETNEANVVYRRKDGNYGLIEPEF
ncbi:MAG TPA: ribosome-associated translation inhibitor RaiA [Acetivibrio sp.]|uniref:ribosome hibernation-promoting factor, HPF/YfiA family n=1 Tax=Acetivibrio sp. TaxID=1872092 RepID=UPI002C49FAF8|nr:ribosome-associated translation inhibitor RaiA [Acetivibrio sp.]HOM02355.1 ribosome-associated translation inhibitor RaiA [Acetivibrio sp.]